MKILVIDSDHNWVEMLKSRLEKLGYEIYTQYTGELARIEWEKQQPDLVILDTNVRDVDALDLCLEMRGKHDALVLVTTTYQNPHLREMCLEYGADDCLLKPYFPTQLPAYINTSMARRGLLNRGRNIPSSIITVGSIRVEASLLRVSVDNRTTSLTPMESMVLLFLALNANNVCTASQINSYAWRVNKYDFLAHSYILKLRHKIEQDPMNPKYLLTIPGVGYTLVGHDSDEALQ
jgi:DNA-binding response OmpR family regulator